MPRSQDPSLSTRKRRTAAPERGGTPKAQRPVSRSRGDAAAEPACGLELSFSLQFLCPDAGETGVEEGEGCGGDGNEGEEDIGKSGK